MGETIWRTNTDRVSAIMLYLALAGLTALELVRLALPLTIIALVIASCCSKRVRIWIDR